MATVNKRPSGKWQATVRKDGRSQSKSFSKRVDALKWAREGSETDRNVDASGGSPDGDGRVVALDISGGQLLLTREEAAACGLSRFWTGRMCKFGHLADRYVSNGQCVTCNAEKTLARERQKRASDPSYRMFRSVHRRSGQVLRGRVSPSVAVGCSHGKLRTYMAMRFTEGMEWAKYGQWEVDHVIPLSAAGSLEELVRLCHYRTLQPLWKRDNLIKGGA